MDNRHQSVELDSRDQSYEAFDTENGTSLSRSGSGELNVALRSDIPPDGGYGWICTACVFLLNAHTWGVNSAWGVFLAHFLSRSTLPNATHLEYALIGGLSISQALLVSPLAAHLHERVGGRCTMICGSVLISASFLASSFATQVWHLFLSQGACFGYGMGLVYITASAILPQWFQARRSLALGIATSGAGFGGLAYNLGAGAGIESIGWQWTYRVLAIATLAVNLACALLLRERKNFSHAPGGVLRAKELAHTETWLLIGWGWLTELGYITLLYSLPTYAQSIGLTAQQGSIVGAALNLGLAFGRPAVGYFSDRWGRINVAASMTALCGIFCLAIWVAAKSYSVLLVFAIASGTVTGTFWSCVVPVTAEVSGLEGLRSRFGMICLPLVIPTTFAEALALQLVEDKGYLSAQIFVGFMFLGGAASVWALRSWKMADDEDLASGVREGKRWLTVHGLFSLAKI